MPDVLLDTLVKAVHHMRTLQREFVTYPGRVNTFDLDRAEKEVDDLIELHLLPSLRPTPIDPTGK